MRAIILAGGKGTRLLPYTTTIPKPIVPVGGMAIMEIVIRQLANCGFKHLTLAVNHHAQLIMAYFEDGRRWGVTLDYSLEDKPLSTMGPLTLIDDLPEHFLVMNGDVLTDINYADFYQSHVDSGAIGTIATYKREVKIDFGVLGFAGGKNLISKFVEKPVEHFCVSMGVYAFSREIMKYIPEDVPFGFDDLMLKLIAEKQDIRAHPFEGYWLDIGRPEDYDRANNECDEIMGRLLPLNPQ
ncbi:MAG: NTP transferase domain-containing protein [Phycisphaerae bacterium]|nr:NTP transferase domain-containing protein [Phycisphaerae bacterium]